MANILLELNGRTGLSYSESIGEMANGTPIHEVSYIRITTALSIEKKFAGSVDITLQDLLAQQTKIAKKNKDNKKSTILLYEQMIKDIQAELNKITTSK